MFLSLIAPTIRIPRLMTRYFPCARERHNRVDDIPLPEPMVARVPDNRSQQTSYV
jgi:hypothetical protein